MIAPDDTILHYSAPSDSLTITEACLVGNRVSVQWMVSEAVSHEHINNKNLYHASLPPAMVVLVYVQRYITTHL